MAEFELDSVETKQNVTKKNVQDKKKGKVGEIAHYHPRENDEEAWEEACFFVSHTVNDEAGLTINEELYKGKLIVPACVANYLNQMEQAVEQSEIGLFRSSNVSRTLYSN